ncbi:hypothetical protein, partial [Escherichia coli]|uniref:hypothetical protein n=1 Tax=Escherichia coli TaxID=562 RepID=UPI001123A1EE
PDPTLNPLALLTDITAIDDELNEAPEFTGESTSNDAEKDKVAQTKMVLNQLKIKASEKGLIDDYQQSVM